jgi:hypothetical protein
MAVVKESRLSRWSRLKQVGGADEHEEKVARAENEDREKVETVAENRIARHGNDIMIAPEPADLPGGDFRRNAIPVMAPLAGVEDSDTRFESAPPEAMALLDGELPHDAALAMPPVEGGVGPVDEVERELSEDEQEVVAALPPLESLTKESDFTPFLADKVPAFIRRRALSILWRSDPLLANLDGMNDYDEDFNVIDTLIDIAKDSSYKIGKGYTTDDEIEDADDVGDDQQITSEENTIENEDQLAGIEEEAGNENTSDEDKQDVKINTKIRDVRKPDQG